MSKVLVSDDHAQNILQRMWQQSKSERFCDVVLIAGTDNTRIPLHRSVLCASSEIFEEIFTSPIAVEAKLPDVDGEILGCIVKFIYLGRIEIRDEIVKRLLIAAHSMHLDSLINSCAFFFEKQLNPTNCLEIAQLAEQHKCELLTKKAKAFCMDHFIDVYKTNEFLNLNAEQLGKLLASDNLRAPAEEDVFKSLMTWIKFDPAEREQYKDELLKFVRLPLMQPSFLIDYVRPVCTSSASVELCNAATDWHLLPKRRSLNENQSIKPRTPRKASFLMALQKQDNKLNILFNCPRRLKWMKCLGYLDYRFDFGIAIMNDCLFIVGGQSRSVTALNTAICVNLTTMKFRFINSMIVGRSGAAVATLNGFIYAVGGCKGNIFLSSVEKWDAQTNTWCVVASMECCRIWCGITILNQKLFVVGGFNGTNDLNTSECYDPEKNIWVKIAPVCKTRKSPAVTAVGDILYAVGGFNNKTAERYDAETDEWTLMCTFNVEITRPFCTCEDKIIFHRQDCIMEYDTGRNKFQLDYSIQKLKELVSIFLYSGDLPESKFTEN